MGTAKSGKGRDSVGLLRALSSTGQARGAGGMSGSLLVGMSERVRSSPTAGRLKGRNNNDENEKARAAARVRSALNSDDDDELAEALDDFNSLQSF